MQQPPPSQRLPGETLEQYLLRTKRAMLAEGMCVSDRPRPSRPPLKLVSSKPPSPKA